MYALTILLTSVLRWYASFLSFAFRSGGTLMWRNVSGLCSSGLYLPFLGILMKVMLEPPEPSWPLLGGS